MSVMMSKRMSWMVALALSVSMPLATASEGVVEALEAVFVCKYQDLLARPIFGL